MVNLEEGELDVEEFSILSLWVGEGRENIFDGVPTEGSDLEKFLMVSLLRQGETRESFEWEIIELPTSGP